jgi:3-deoxy-manno-octulosonate cytidylyltransferase (CMP-KDO synthetase)
MTEFIGIIPARYASSRFPGKPLCDLVGKTMIQRVYESVMKWDHWKAVYVATDSQKIVDSCKKDNIPCIMTGDYHLDCLDRAAEVVSILESKGNGADKYIVIQGDEPLFNSDTLNVDTSSSIVNFYTEVHDEKELYDPNAVKVVVSKNQNALYFSRFSVPYHDEKTKRNNVDIVIHKQIGVYVFSGEMLKLYSALKPTYLENAEGIGLNRLLENDVNVSMRYTPYDSISVDTTEDRDRIIKIIERMTHA